MFKAEQNVSLETRDVSSFMAATALRDIDPLYHNYSEKVHLGEMDTESLGIKDNQKNIDAVLFKIFTSIVPQISKGWEWKRTHHSDIGWMYAFIGSISDANNKIVAVINMNNHYGVLSWTIWTTSPQRAKRINNAIRAAIPAAPEPEEEPEDKSIVPVTFWRMARGIHGEVKESAKDIQCPYYKDVKQNYPQVNKEISTLFKVEKPDEQGKIILWHGPPGMGKTYAIRALMRDWHWRLGASIEIVLDPENMFGNADYLHDLILNDDNDADDLRLIIIEDSAEFFTRDDKENRQGFSRLLNLTDGIIGQGDRVIFLITANEKLDEIDPAVMRTGRCIQEVHFGTFNRHQADRWLKGVGADPIKVTNHGPFILADLYAQAPVKEPEDSKKGTETMEGGEVSKIQAKINKLLKSVR
jgi:hypothetical protein